MCSQAEIEHIPSMGGCLSLAATSFCQYFGPGISLLVLSELIEQVRLLCFEPSPSFPSSSDPH